MDEPDRIKGRDAMVSPRLHYIYQSQSGDRPDYKNGLHTAAELLGKKAEKLINFMNQVQYVNLDGDRVTQPSSFVLVASHTV